MEVLLVSPRWYSRYLVFRDPLWWGTDSRERQGELQEGLGGEGMPCSSLSSLRLLHTSGPGLLKCEHEHDTQGSLTESGVPHRFEGAWQFCIPTWFQALTPLCYKEVASKGLFSGLKVPKTGVTTVSFI